jgi:hypothetical protein
MVRPLFRCAFGGMRLLGAQQQRCEVAGGSAPLWHVGTSCSGVADLPAMPLLFWSKARS